MATNTKSSRINAKTASPSELRTKVKVATTNTIGGDRAYLILIGRFPLRPLRTNAELDAASQLIDELTDRDDLSRGESDYLEVLGDLVEKYEAEYVKMPYISDAAMLRSLMEENGVRQADVVRGTGISKTVLSLVLNGKRELTREHIATLSKFFEVDPAAFLGPASNIRKPPARL